MADDDQYEPDYDDNDFGGDDLDGEDIDDVADDGDVPEGNQDVGLRHSSALKSEIGPTNLTSYPLNVRLVGSISLFRAKK